MRPRSPVCGWLVGAFFAAGALSCASANAETPEELDALAQRSADEQTGIALAREQGERGEFLEALATLERVLAVHPKSREARLAHAILLCRVDDLRGGQVEIAKLKESHYSAEAFTNARATCGLRG